MIKFTKRRSVERNRQPKRETTNSGRLAVEQLEERALLAIDGAVAANHFRAYDVNRDGIVSPLDALQIINQLNRHGIQRLNETSARMAASASAPGSDDPDAARFDVNGDGIISPLDALMVINQLNDPDIVRVRLEVTDLGGAPITQIPENGDFQLRVYVQDLRGLEDGGVYTGYTDIQFDAALATAIGEISFAAPYTTVTSGNFDTPGLIDNAGATSALLTPLGAEERLMFTVPMRATGGGTINFSSGPTGAPAFVFGVFGEDTAVPPENIDFGTISLDVMAGPTMSIDNVSLPEGDDGFADFVFTVTLSSEAIDTVTVDFATEPGTATPDVDYVSKSGTLIFEPGTTTQTITIQVIGDLISEPNETFFVNLSNLTGPASIADGQGLGTIIDDDGLPMLAIDDVTDTEGNVGTKDFVFTVTLSGLSSTDVTVDYTTAPGTATEGVDYIATSGTLVFTPGGPSTQTITVQVIGDTMYEEDETFAVLLTNASGAVLFNAIGVGTILNDDDPPQIDIADAGVVLEPPTGTVDATFVVTLSEPAGVPVTVAYATQSGTATAGEDFIPDSGVLTFAPGETQKSIAIQVLADDTEEPDETFFVILSSPENGVLGQSQGQAIIRDQTFESLARIRLSFTDLNGNEITEIHGGEPFLLNVFVQDLRGDVAANEAGVYQAYLDILYDNNFLSVVPGTVQFGSDYDNGQEFEFSDLLGLIDDSGAFDGFTPLGLGETLLFNTQVIGLTGGSTTVTPQASTAIDREVLLFGLDRALAPSEVQFIGDTIDILQPSVITTSSESILEGDAGTQLLAFTVTVERVDDRVITVAYSTSPGTATAGVDYQQVSGILTFEPGVTTQTVNVPIIGDTLYEDDETFFLNLSNATNAVISPDSRQVVGTILNDDAPPAMTFDDVTVIEGLADAVVTVRLSEASGRVTTVNYATGGGTALPGVDYAPTSGQLVFQPGEVEKTITIVVLANMTLVGDETFLVNFSDVQGATLTRPSATVTIQQLPASSISGYVYGDVNGNGVFDNGDVGLRGVTINLIGETFQGDPVTRSVVTDEAGRYLFDNLAPGVYRVVQVQPGMLQDGEESLGNAGGYISANDEFTIPLAPGVHAEGYNFGERGILSQFLTHFIFR